MRTIMTEEQKQALIEHCKLRIKVLQTYWNVNAKDMALAKLDLEAYEIALAALNLQPVKLPKQTSYRSPDGENFDLYYKEDMINAIRAAGYQVEGE